MKNNIPIRVDINIDNHSAIHKVAHANDCTYDDALNILISFGIRQLILVNTLDSLIDERITDNE